MILTPLPIDGAFVVAPQPHADERGAFARLWCRDTFARAGIDFIPMQASTSFNTRAGTLRGLHFAWPPARETKLVRCARGRAHDVLLDLRPGSRTRGTWIARVLDADSREALLVPPGVAHGFQTLDDGTEIHYTMDEAYRPECAGGVRPDDPAFGIPWPLPVRCISEADRTRADFDAEAHAARWAQSLSRSPDAA